MLLNEFYTPSHTDLKLLSLIVLSNGQLPADTIKGDQQLQTSLKKLSNMDIVLVVNDNIVLTNSGKSVSILNGLSDRAGSPTKVAYNNTVDKL